VLRFTCSGRAGRVCYYERRQRGQVGRGQGIGIIVVVHNGFLTTCSGEYLLVEPSVNAASANWPESTSLSAELAVLGATKNSGQRCTAVKRILCVEAVADQFAEQVLKRAKKLKCGDPMDPSVDIGTVIHEDAAKEIERRVEAAVQDGARLLHGNNPEGAFYPPTVVDHVPYTCELILQETFGPVIPIVRTP